MSCASVDTWLKLHASLIAIIFGLNQMAEACKKKFNSLYKVYKEEKLANGISGSNHQVCKFYDSFDQWWHQTGTVMKYVTTYASDYVGIEDSTMDIDNDPNLGDTPIPTPATKVDKKNFQKLQSFYIDGRK